MVATYMGFMSFYIYVLDTWWEKSQLWLSKLLISNWSYSRVRKSLLTTA
jgi:hypothetical protein